MGYYGVLGVTFKINRILQAICLIAIIGMTANFISQMVQNNATPPKVLVGTISVVSTSTGPRHRSFSNNPSVNANLGAVRPASQCYTAS